MPAITMPSMPAIPNSNIDPSALNQSNVSIGTPTLATKSISNVSGPQKPKTSQIIPPRIDLEPFYAAVKTFIPPEKWTLYKESVSNLAYGMVPLAILLLRSLAYNQLLTLPTGRLNQAEFSAIIDPLVTSHNGEKEYHHNRLILAILANVTREVPDPGVAPWVSANDKPSATAGSKPASGDASERKVKGEVMQLPARDRRRIKDLAQNDVGSPHSSPAIFLYIDTLAV